MTKMSVAVSLRKLNSVVVRALPKNGEFVAKPLRCRFYRSPTECARRAPGCANASRRTIGTLPCAKRTYASRAPALGPFKATAPWHRRRRHFAGHVPPGPTGRQLNRHDEPQPGTGGDTEIKRISTDELAEAVTALTRSVGSKRCEPAVRQQRA